MKKFLLVLSFLFISLTNQLIQHSFDDESKYFTTWGTAIISTGAPTFELSNNSIRQIVHISESGDNLRLKLSNKFGKTDLVIREITIADSASQGSGEVDVNTLVPLTFNGKAGVTIPSGSEIYSDTVPYPLKSLSEIAISIYFGETPTNLSGHSGSWTNSFIEEGNKIYVPIFSKENKIANWYFISAVEVYSDSPKKVIVCFGDSITNGQGSSIDKQNRWTDFLSLKLHLNQETSDIAVVNKGINGNRIITQGLERFPYDVLEVKGVTHIMVLYGVNDINLLNATSSEIISAYKQIIQEAHNNNLFIFAGTILPYGNFHRWTEERENYRKEVNHWIRNTKPEDGGFDAVFDYDELIKDPYDETKIYSDYDSGDGIHPNSEGYQIITQAINDLELFTRKAHFNSKRIEIVNKKGLKFKLNFEIEKDEEVDIKINGICEKSNGFRVLTNNNEGIKTSDYFYSGKLDKEFEFSFKLKVCENSDYIVIRRPLSTINIDNIIVNSIEVSKGDIHQTFDSLEEGEFIK